MSVLGCLTRSAVLLSALCAGGQLRGTTDSFLLDALIPVGTSITVAEYDLLYWTWPEAARRRAEHDPLWRRQFAAERYGFLLRPGDLSFSGPPVGWVWDGSGRWSANCLLCHAGAVSGQSLVIGAPNVRLDLMTFVEDRIALAKRFPVRVGTSPDNLLLRRLYTQYFAYRPLNRSRGVTSVWLEGALMLGARNRNMRLDPIGAARLLSGNGRDFGVTTADLDPPAWWNTPLKSHIFSDGFAPLNPRSPMAAALPPGNPVRRFEPLFTRVLSEMRRLEPPRYPGTIDGDLAREGAVQFDTHCAHCHGHYTPSGVAAYPTRTVPLGVIGTDALRLRSGLTTAFRNAFAESWLGGYGSVVTDPKGYVAPPLRGVWATAPYFHNGSVPTLFHLLHPKTRPARWLGDRRNYDLKQVGLPFLEIAPTGTNRTLDDEQRRRVYDTFLPGKSAAGHLFVDDLTEQGKAAVLEYLKTLN